MGVAFDFAPDRPEHIETILNGLDRYNPETTQVFQDYVAEQCENQTYDCYANLALLKLYQFNPHLSNAETITAILVKTLTVFPSPDFSLCLSLLPPATTVSSSRTLSSASSDASSLATSIRALTVLNNALSTADYALFWQTLRSDDLYADLTSEVSGFEELMRVRIAATVSSAVREVDRGILEVWLDTKGTEFEKFVGDVCGWEIGDEGVKVPTNKENEAKGSIVRENVKFDQFARVIRRSYEQPV